MSKLGTEARIEALVKVLKGYQPERVYLFGSAARGEADETWW